MAGLAQVIARRSPAASAGSLRVGGRGGLRPRGLAQCSLACTAASGYLRRCRTGTGTLPQVPSNEIQGTEGPSCRTCPLFSANSPHALFTCPRQRLRFCEPALGSVHPRTRLSRADPGRAGSRLDLTRRRELSRADLGLGGNRE